MPRILAAASTFPEHSYSQAAVCDVVSALFSGLIPSFDTFGSVFRNARVAERQFVMPLAWYGGAPGSGERNHAYLDKGIPLAVSAAATALARANVPPEAVSHVIFVSSTGLATPTVDVYLVNNLNMKPTVRRLPLWGLGCAAGAAGLARAAECAMVAADAAVLVVALECCSLTFQAGDTTRKNVVATSIFGDGAAAAVVAGDAVGGGGPEVIATQSYLFPESYRIMGWDVEDGGLQLVLSPKLPPFIRSNLPALVSSFLQGNGLDTCDFYITHPGGAKIIDAYRDALMLEPLDLALSEESLARHGNVSSVSVIEVLESWLSGRGHHGGHGLLSAFGPGFSAELVLLRE